MLILIHVDGVLPGTPYGATGETFVDPSKAYISRQAKSVANTEVSPELYRMLLSLFRLQGSFTSKVGSFTQFAGFLVTNSSQILSYFVMQYQPELVSILW